MNRRAAALLGLAAAAVLSWGGPASAIDIQKVTSPLGITAWLVEDQSIPLVSMSFAFEGGAAQDPADRPGVANMLSGLLDEGAGDLDSAAFQERLDRLSIGLSFDAGPDTFRGSLKTLTDNRAEATRLLRLALTEPRFDAEPVERTRAQLLISLKRGEKSPGRLAADAMRRAVFPDHPYGRAVQGTAESIAAIGVDDLRSFRQKTFARDNLKVAIVGAIDAGGAAAMLDEVFGGLPAKADLVPVPDVTPQSGKHIDIALGVPQALIRFSAPGIKEDDPDLIPAAVAAHILGGGSDFAALPDRARRARPCLFGQHRPRRLRAFRPCHRRHVDARRPEPGGHRSDHRRDRPFRPRWTDRG